MTIEVEKEDIRKIGNVWSNEDGFLAIICNGDTANIEEILLRNVLKCFGEEYHIVQKTSYGKTMIMMIGTLISSSSRTCRMRNMMRFQADDLIICDWP